MNPAIVEDREEQDLEVTTGDPPSRCSNVRLSSVASWFILCNRPNTDASAKCVGLAHVVRAVVYGRAS
jgi:hypothetical protein